MSRTKRDRRSAASRKYNFALCHWLWGKYLLNTGFFAKWVFSCSVYIARQGFSKLFKWSFQTWIMHQIRRDRQTVTFESCFLSYSHCSTFTCWVKPWFFSSISRILRSRAGVGVVFWLLKGVVVVWLFGFSYFLQNMRTPRGHSPFRINFQV